MIDTIKPGQTVVDLGANHGYFTLLMSCLVDNGSVISIEASPDIYKRLDAHVALNHASNVKLHNIAVADHVGTVKLFNPLRYNEGSATIVPGPVDRGGTTVACDRFLSILGDDLRRTSFVKIDIEGAERSALEDILAGRDLFSRPLTIVSEVSPENRDLIQTFADAGFSVRVIPNNYELSHYLRSNFANRYALPLSERRLATDDYVFQLL